MHICITQYDGVNAISGVPLAAGILVATARLDPVLSDSHFELRVERRPLGEAVEQMGQPDVLGLSLYPWNAAYSLAVAAQARRVHPQALIVVGGPAVPRQPESVRAFMDANPGLDVLVFGEGELVFRDLLRAVHDGTRPDGIPALALRQPDGTIYFTGPEVRVQDFSQTGSPYLDGTFEALLRAHPERFAMALIETNRGCPFSCTFCDWSSTKQVVEVPIERVRAELDRAVSLGLPNTCFTDANFGIRRRDASIAEHLAQLRRQTGRPIFCYFYLTKNNHQRNLQTIEIFQRAGIDHCVGLAVQDFDSKVLTAIKRDNIQTDHSRALREICAERGIRTHNELILGLPGQTRDSFATTVLAAMPGHPRHEFRVFLCRLIDNTELARPQTRERYEIESRRCLWQPTEPGWDPIVDEHQEIVVGTRDMPIADWRQACRFAHYAVAAYNQRLLRVVLRVLDAQGLDRRAWLERLCAALDASSGFPVHERMGRSLDRILDSMLAGGPLALPLEGLGDRRFEMAEALAATALCDVDAFYAEVRTLTEEVLGEALSAAFLDELFRFQSLCTPRHGAPEVLEGRFAHDWVLWDRAAVGTPLPVQDTTVRFTPPAYVRVPEPGSFVGLHLAVGLAGASMGELDTPEPTVQP
jgi:hypothetical protein